jgi:hypothetical protein
MQAMNDKLKRLRNASTAAEIAGWYGTGAIVLAYILVSFNIVAGGGASYQLLNLSGAIGIIIISSRKKVRQSVILNVFWAGIATIALLRLAFH